MRIFFKYYLLLIAIINAPTTTYCQKYDLKYNDAMSVVEHDQRRISKINKEFVLRNAHSGVEIHPGFNMVLSCVLDLLVHWGREKVTLLTDDIHFGSGSVSSGRYVVGWFKSKGIAINLKIITTLYGKEFVKISSILSEGSDFIIMCRSNLTEELLNVESQPTAIFKNYIIVDSKTPKLFANLESVYEKNSQFILVSPTYFGKIYEELIVSEINLFHIAYVNYTDSWEMVKFGSWSSKKRLNLLADFDYYDADGKLKNQSIRIVKKSSSDCGKRLGSSELAALAMNLNFNEQCVAPEKPHYGIYLGNGTFDGIIGMLQNRNGDIASCSFYAQSNRWIAMRFAAPLTFTTMTIWYRQADATISPFAHVLAFSKSTWTVAVGTLLTLSGILAIAFIKINILMNGKFEQLNKWIFTGDMVVDILNKMPGPSNKMLSGVFYFWVLLMFAHYNSVLKSFLISKNQEILFTSLEDIVQRKDYRVLIKKGALLHNYFMISDEDVHKDIYRRIQSHEDNLINNYNQVIDFLCNEKAVFIEFLTGVELKLGEDAANSLPCTLVKKSQVYLTTTAFSSFRRDFPYESIFKTKILKYFEGGIYKRKFQSIVQKKNEAATESFALTLLHTLTPIIVLSAGLICSMIALCVELCSHRRQQFKHN